MLTPTLWRFEAPANWNRLFRNGRSVDQLFDSFFTPIHATGAAPAADVRETADAYEIALELPGIDPAQVNVAMENGVLTVSGEKMASHEEHTEYHVVERQYGKFERQFTLPRTVAADAITARYSDGVLVVTLPKAETAKPRKVEVKVGK